MYTGIGHVCELETMFNGSSVYTEPILKKLDQIMDEKLTTFELRQVLEPELKEIESRRVKAAKEATAKIIPEIKTPETPEESGVPGFLGVQHHHEVLPVKVHDAAYLLPYEAAPAHAL